ncbi:hypothetical protein MKW94_011124 [Papaver nudicaule]|uniref:RING-type domain-containing protein n=1 Tax=Papaver nudicaule TaxID=74823 RepID=A0AA41VMB5_PAPNU|nr:hypothetical protein [Papaver nudicaule]
MSELGKRSSYSSGGTSSTANGAGAGANGAGAEDFKLSLLFELFEDGKTELTVPISDAEYAENLGFQEALMASFHKLKQTQIIRAEVKNEQNLDNTADTTATTSRPAKRVKAEPIEGVKMELGGSFCGICKKLKTMGEIFVRRGTAGAGSKCAHTFCVECLRKHIMARIQKNEIVIKCPGMQCQEILEPQSCQGLIPKEVFDRWGGAVSESQKLAGGTKKA